MVIASAKRLASSYTPLGPIGLTLPQYVSGWGWTSGSPYTSLAAARRKRASLARPRPMRLWVPRLPTLRILMGISVKSFGDAGLARCMTASTAPSTVTGRLTSWRTNAKRGSSISSRMLSSRPVTKLSTHTTSSPRASRARHNAEPRKPAPPLTTTRIAATIASPARVGRVPGRPRRRRLPCPAMRPDASAVAAVVVSYDSTGYLGPCLSSLRADGVDSVVVVENGRNDRSRMAAVAAGADWVQAGANLGYGRAANLGAGQAGAADADYLLVCNPDIELRPGSVAALGAALDADAELAAVGPRIANPDGSLY